MDENTHIFSTEHNDYYVTPAFDDTSLRHDFAPIPAVNDNHHSMVFAAVSTSLTVNMDDKYIITFRGCAELFGYNNFQYYTQDSSMDLLQIKNIIHSFMINPNEYTLTCYCFTSPVTTKSMTDNNIML